MPRLAPTVIEESIKYSPEIVPWYFFSLIEQESCISLTHSKCWNEKAELKNSRENGVGVGQLTRAWDKNGKLRFDNLTSLSKKYSSLREMTWNNIKTRPDLQVRSMILLHRESYKKLNVVKDEFERLAMSDAAYNGGYGHLNKERIACGVLKNCDPQKWFGNVENIKTIKNPNLAITIRINYHADMLEGLPEFIKMVKRDFDDRFVVYAIRINPTPEFEKEFIPVNAEAEAYALEYVIDLLKENNLSIERYMTNLTPTASACYARMNYALVVDTDGTIRKCTEFLDDEKWNNIGTIKNGVFEIDYYKHMQWLHPNPQHLIDQKCYECKDYPNCCGGLCPAQWLITKQVVCNPLRSFNKSFLEQYIYEKCNKK